MSHHDVIVVGTGLAGLTAAVRLAESGARVLVVAKGIGATHLSAGTIDVLGYAPERVERPGEALAALVAERPDHPYAHVGADGRRRGARLVRGARRRRAARALRLHGRAGGEPAAADGGRRAAALRARAGDDGRPATCAAAPRSAWLASARSRTSTPRCSPTCSRPGNNMFNSFGNLATDPSAALLFVDFDTGETLHLSGTAAVEWTAPHIGGDDGGVGRRTRFVVEVVASGTSAGIHAAPPRPSPHNPTIT